MDGKIKHIYFISPNPFYSFFWFRPCSIKTGANAWLLASLGQKCGQRWSTVAVSNFCEIYFHPDPWGRFPFWKIFFKCVESTNRSCFFFQLDRDDHHQFRHLKSSASTPVKLMGRPLFLKSLDIQTPPGPRYLDLPKHTKQTPNLRRYDWMSRGIYFDDIRLQLKLQKSALKRCPFGGRQKLAILKRRSNGKTHFGLNRGH